MCTNLLYFLAEFISEVKNKLDEIENDAKSLTENHNYKLIRVKKRKLQFGEINL